MHLQELPVPSVHWQFEQNAIEPDKLPLAGYIGQIGTLYNAKPTRDVQIQTHVLEAAVQSIQLAFTTGQPMCGIAPIYRSRICIAHFHKGDVWVYNTTGKFEQKIQIPGVREITGLLSSDRDKGKLVVVDQTQEKIHFVTLSTDLKILQHVTKDVPLIADRISLGLTGDLIVSDLKGNVVVVTEDCQLSSTLQISPDDKVFIRRVAQTKSGFTMCERLNNHVYFTDSRGNILHTSTDCINPRNVTNISWGHVLIPDEGAHDIKVFSDSGDFLGQIHENQSGFTQPYYVHVDEATRRMYIGCGPPDKYEVRVYKFEPSDLPALPVTCSSTKITLNVDLLKV